MSFEFGCDTEWSHDMTFVWTFTTPLINFKYVAYHLPVVSSCTRIVQYDWCQISRCLLQRTLYWVLQYCYHVDTMDYGSWDHGRLWTMVPNTWDMVRPMLTGKPKLEQNKRDLLFCKIPMLTGALNKTNQSSAFVIRVLYKFFYKPGSRFCKHTRSAHLQNKPFEFYFNTQHRDKPFGFCLTCSPTTAVKSTSC